MLPLLIWAIIITKGLGWFWGCSQNMQQGLFYSGLCVSRMILWNYLLRSVRVKRLPKAGIVKMDFSSLLPCWTECTNITIFAQLNLKLSTYILFNYSTFDNKRFSKHEISTNPQRYDLYSWDIFFPRPYNTHAMYLFIYFSFMNFSLPFFAVVLEVTGQSSIFEMGN